MELWSFGLCILIMELWSFGLVRDSSITNEIDQSQPSLEVSITEEFYQTNHGSYHTNGLGSFENGLFYLQYSPYHSPNRSRPKCCEPLQKMRVRLGACKINLSPQ